MLRPQDPPIVPEDTRRVARAAFPKGTLCLRIADALGAVYQGYQFTALFPSHGQPAAAPGRLALAMVLQFVENLSDREAADAVRGRIDWKCALGLALTDPGFDHTVLSEFRTRLIAGSAELLLLDTLLRRLQEQGLVKARGRQRTDSTHVLAAVRTLNRLEHVGETMRAALNEVATAAPEWLQALAPAVWYERYGRPVKNYRLPETEAARQDLAAMIGADGQHLLSAVDAAVQQPDLARLPAIQILRQVWATQYVEEDGRLRLGSAAELPRSAEQACSPYDPDARYSNKRDTSWVGYKVQVTETCDPACEGPHVITNVETTPATTPDDSMAAVVHQSLEKRGLLPGERLVDKGYRQCRSFRHLGALYHWSSFLGSTAMAGVPAGLPAGVRVGDPISLGVIAKTFPPDRVQQVLAETGKASERERDLPAQVMVHYAIAMALYMGSSTREVLRRLLEGLRWLWGTEAVKVAGKSGISQARSRLGETPLRRLYEQAVQPVATRATKGAWHRTWRLVSLDGSSLDVADTAENGASFGYPGSSRGESALPQLRFVALVENGTHVLFGAKLGRYADSETTLAHDVVHALRPGMLCLADRYFFGYALWWAATATGADLLWRVRSNLRLPRVAVLADGSYLSVVYPSGKDRRHATNGTQVRVVEYRLEGVADAEPLYRLVTTILDHFWIKSIPGRRSASQTSACAVCHVSECCVGAGGVHLRRTRVVDGAANCLIAGPHPIRQHVSSVSMRGKAICGLSHSFREG